MLRSNFQQEKQQIYFIKLFSTVGKVGLLNKSCWHTFHVELTETLKHMKRCLPSGLKQVKFRKGNSKSRKRNLDTSGVGEALLKATDQTFFFFSFLEKNILATQKKQFSVTRCHEQSQQLCSRFGEVTRVHINNRQRVLNLQAIQLKKLGKSHKWATDRRAKPNCQQIFEIMLEVQQLEKQ